VTILLVESSSDCADGCATSDENEWAWEGRHVDLLNGDGWYGGTEPPPAGQQSNYFDAPGAKPPLGRHTSGANYAYSDGHVHFLNVHSVGQRADGTASDHDANFAGRVADTSGSRTTYCPNTSCSYCISPVTGLEGTAGCSQ
jgi:prepilin-type processing-associated H-X9-DG protein